MSFIYYIVFLIIIFSILQYIYIPKDKGYIIIKELINKQETDIILKKWNKKIIVK